MSSPTEPPRSQPAATQLAQEKDILTARSAELTTENRLRRRLAGFAEQIAASLDDLDTEGRRRLLRLVVEKVRVTGWRVEIHLKIPLPDDPPDNDPPPPDPEPDNGPSSDMRLRSLRDDHVRVMQQSVDGRGRHRFGHQLVEPARVDVGADRDRSFLVGGVDDSEQRVGGVR